MTRPDSPLSQAIPARAYRGRMAHAIDEETVVFHADGGLLVNVEGRVLAFDDWNALQVQYNLADFELITLTPSQLLLPGFIDLHVHLPQMEVTGHQAENLLMWLEEHIFAAESRFSDPEHARRVSAWFFRQLLANGTTTAAVFLTSHNEATKIAFETAWTMGNRVVMGQNLMDANAPAELVRPTSQMLQETEAHCEDWHGVDEGRIRYAWMPRFALTSTEDLMKGLGALRKRFPDVYLHTHLSEQTTEIQAVLHQFPWALDYTDVYEKHGLLGPRTILAHGIHLSDTELDRIQQAESALAHCPGSNFFLKSGPFRWFEVLRRRMRFGLGSDVGAGPELSLLKVMKEAQYMQADRLVSLPSLLYAATLGGARALIQDDCIGNFLPGKEADFLILDTQAKSALANPVFPATTANEPSEITLDDFLSLFSRLVYLGDDRLVMKTFIRGREVYCKEGNETV